MSSILELQEPALNLPVNYTWNIDPDSGDGSNFGSPLFGTNECFDSKAKFQLHLVRINQIDKVYLEVAACNAKQIFLQYQINYRGLSKNSNNNYQRFNLGERAMVWSTTAKNTTFHKIIKCKIVYLKPYGYQSLLNHVSIDFGALRKDASFTDVTLNVGLKKFTAHKSVLSARSPVFKTMLSNENFVEHKEGLINIADMAPEVLEGLLEFIYTGLLSNLGELAPELLVAAHKYQISSLVAVCELSMTKTVTVDNAAKYLTLADMYKLYDLKAKALEFINSNPNSVMKTDGWKELIEDNLVLLKELYKGTAVGKM